MASRTTRTAIKCGCFVVAFALGCHGSAFATVFSVGDETTYGQSEWGTTGSLAQNTLLADFSAVYGGAVDVGDLSKFYMEFDGGTAIDAYLPQTGPIGVLDGVLLDPTSSASGAFGGDVVALNINVNFSDAGFLASSLGVPFGNLILNGFGNSLDGLSVSQFLVDASTCLGGGVCLLSVTDMDATAFQLNGSFDSGTPDAWANDHLVTNVATTVPEPLSVSLFGAGLASAFAMRRRKKKAA